MKIKTSELSGPALDWAVAEAVNMEETREDYRVAKDDRGRYHDWLPSSRWSQGGPILDRFRPQFIQSFSDHVSVQKIDNERKNFVRHGPTLLVAAMRCYVASKLGDEVDVPDELIDATKED